MFWTLIIWSPENWLIFEILSITKYRIDLDHFKGCIGDLLNQSEEMKFFIFDHKGTRRRLSIREFNEEYEKTWTLSRYFRRREFHNFYSNIFGDIKYIGSLEDKSCKKLSKAEKNEYFDISATSEYVDRKNTKTTLLGKDAKSIGKDFFYDDPNSPWQPLPEHSLEESPCYPIIGLRGNFYYCRLHPDVENIHLESIEHHCKYQEPEKHKAEILKERQNVFE